MKKVLLQLWCVGLSLTDIDALQNSPISTKARTITTDQQRESFHRDGFVILSGVLTDKEISKLHKAGKDISDRDTGKASAYFDVVERGIMANGPSNPDISEEERRKSAKIFRDIALRSNLPQVAAELMDLNPSEENVRVLRDIFLGKGVGDMKTCGWHVDDQSFWPEAYKSSPSADGINAWIAMDNMPIAFGGGFACAAGSHKAMWRHKAYESIGQVHEVLEGQTKEEMYNMIKENGFLSCIIHQTSPELHETMEEIGVIHDVKMGDVVCHTRWCFHKTVPLTEDGDEFYKSNNIRTLNRYSVRYVPGTARLPMGFCNELSMLVDPRNTGKKLNDVTGAWYPQVWPHIEPSVDEKQEELALTKVPLGLKLARDNLNELLEILKSPKDTSKSK